jgi:hypothetical protein
LPLTVTMSESPPPSPSLEIEIDTPPDSLSEQSFSLDSTPLSVKQARTRSTCSHPTPTKRRRQFTGPTTRSSHHTEAQLSDQQDAGSLELANIPLDVGSTDPELIERNVDDDAYLHYVDLVLADGIGIYQISQTIFVVQGWDSRSISGTVSI